ncbi:hypothetical protein AK812_SmicGene45725, partial [Symbiodinium microadriaticum]
ASGRASGNRVAVKCIDLGALTAKERHQASQEEDDDSDDDDDDDDGHGGDDDASGRASGNRVAVKCIDLGALTAKERHQASQEAYLLRRVKHPHIV